MADYYERALYNHILGQQDLRREWYLIFCFAVRHAQGVQHAGEFFLVLRGSGFESHAKYAESIYYRGEDCLYP